MVSDNHKAFDERRLGDDLLDLAGLDAAPADPTPGVRRRIRRARQRRGVGAVALAATTVVAAAVVSGPALDLVTEDREPGYAGTLVQPEPRTPTATPSPEPTFPLPPPWSDEIPDVEYPHLYLPKPYLISEGTVRGQDWRVISFTDDGLSAGCLETPEQELFDPSACFDDWPKGRRAAWITSNAYAAPKPSDEKPKATLVMGAVSVEARSVEIEVAGGRTFTADAVGTPTSNELRFFAKVVPVKGATVTAVRPYDENGELTGRPNLPAQGGPCEGKQPKTGDSGATVTCIRAEAPGTDMSMGERAVTPRG